MEKRYSQLSDYELKQEIKELKVKVQKAEQMGMINEVEVLQRKAIMAEAYLMDPKEFKSGEVVTIKNGDDTPFKIDYMNGVFAWGYYGNQEELMAYPISMLKRA